ncbi:MAG TPA: sigma 54-interacting transcriptional regulator [Gemmatimonadales bacterium]|nr:sigma 54-interacting transcriptional regulator [Gemmatimonadales bacterium]
MAVPPLVDPPAFLMGDSPVMERVRADLKRLAAVPFHVRIEGESGTGKSVAAHLLHLMSSRRKGPFVECNLGTLTNGTAAGDLLGSRKGAYTGAEDRPGVFEVAHGGTAFLDEIADAPREAQRVLRDVVDTGCVRRKGEVRGREVDVRCVFATNANLERRVTGERFLHDLLKRLGLLVVRMPSLAEHGEDIPLLLTHLLASKAWQAACPVPEVSAADLERLQGYDWPGNVRELGKVAEYLLVFGRLPALTRRRKGRGAWRSEVPTALAACGGNRARAARQLGVSRQALQHALRAAGGTGRV